MPSHVAMVVIVACATFKIYGGTEFDSAWRLLLWELFWVSGVAVFCSLSEPHSSPLLQPGSMSCLWILDSSAYMAAGRL